MNKDQPTDIRSGEELNLDNLRPYLKQVNPEWDVDNIDVKQFPSGFSNLTYFLNVGGVEMVLRRPPFGANVKSGHDMSREYRVQNSLKGHFDKVPKMYAFCEDHDIMGCDFYIMERVQGKILRGKGLEADGETLYPIIADKWLDTMVELHATDYKTAGLETLGKPEGYVRRQVEGWSRRYKKAQTSEVKVIDQVMEWLNARIPTESAHTLIHNDYKYDNVMFGEDGWNEVKAVLDWEMSTLGDPLMDFGTTVAYWAEPDDVKHFGPMISLPTYQDGNPTRLELINMYAEKSGRDISNMVYYYVFGLFKTAVVVQQIYYRYHHGHTQDKRFAGLGLVAEGFCFKALRAIEKNRVDNLL